MLTLPINVKNNLYFRDIEKADVYIPLVVATLNSYSKGTLYFGVDQDGEAIGTTISKTTFSNIFKTFEEEISPRIFPLITTLEENKNVIKVEFEGHQKPYSYRGKYYLKDYNAIRTMDYSSTMKEIKILNKNRFFEDEFTSSPVRRLDDSLMKNTFQNAINSKRYKTKNTSYSQRTIAETWGLISKGNVTKAALLLYSKTSPISLTINVYKDEKNISLTSSNLYKGNIITLIKFASDTVKKIYVDNLNIPNKNYNASLVNEIIINAFMHANYNLSTDITIQISPYRLTIINPGEFPKGYQPEDFTHARSRALINNRIISRILYYEGYAHLSGYGYKVLMDAANGNKNYVYKQNKNFFEFTLFMFENKYKCLTIEKAIITIINEKPFIKADEIGEILGKTRRTIQTVLKALKEKNLVVRKGSKKTGFWVVKN